jgi:CRP/FNR family transcriptional regulator, cyclic AMP receptor protein
LQQELVMNEAVRSGEITQKQLAVLKTSEWFAALEPALQEAVLASSHVMVLDAGTNVFHRGDPGDGIYCVLSGAVRFGAIAPSGKELIVALIEAPEWFGEIALFDDGVRTHDAWVDVPSTVLHLPLRHLTKILASNPGVWRHLGRLLVRKL